MSFNSSKRKILFHHLYKTAGTSLINLIGQHFDQNDIVNQDLFGLPGREVKRSDIEEKAEELKRYDFIYGHFPIDIFNSGFDDYFRFTVLRDPVRRIYSLYNDWRSKSDESLADAHPDDKIVAEKARKMDIEEFLEDRPYPINAMFDNGQTRFLSGALHVNELREEHLELARANLDRMDLVGLTEFIDSTYTVLCRMLDWDAPNIIPRLNMRSYKSQGHSKAVLELSKWDILLYEYAQKKCNKFFFNELNDFDPRSLEAIIAASDVYIMDMTMGFEGYCWHEREGVGTDKPYRWTGPGNISTVKFNLIPSEYDYIVELYVISVIDQKIINGLNFYVNQKPVRWVHKGVIDGEQLLLVYLPKKLINEGEDVLSIEVPYTIAHSDIDGSVDDDRKKGIAVTRIHIKKASMR